MNKKINSIVIIRAIAIMMVVIIHCLPTSNLKMLSESETIISTFIHSLMNIGVPLFIMITGALLLQRNEGFKKILSRTLRIVAVLFAFGFVMSLAEYIWIYGISFKSVYSSLFAVISGQTWDAMWYLYMLIGLYLVMPLLSAFVNNCDRKTHLYMLIILFVFDIFIAGINKQFGNIMNFYLPCNAPCLFYALFGDYMYRYKPDISKKIIGLCIVFSIITAAIVSVIFKDIDSAGALLAYNSPIVAILSVSVFTLLMNIDISNKAISFIADNSFGVYVIHCFFIHIITKVLHFEQTMYPLFISVPAMFVVVLTASLFTSCILRKIKLVKYFL